MSSASQNTSPLVVPSNHVVVVEHPCIIKNLDRGVASLGGDATVERFLNNTNVDRQLDLSLRPEDRQARHIPSKSVPTQSILLKITVPKFIGRKRKRDPSAQSASETAQTSSANDKPPSGINAEPDLLQRLQDNDGNYTVQPVGLVTESHKFRTLPEYQYANSTDPLMAKLRDTILTGDYSKVKTFALDPYRGVKPGLNIGMPPVMNVQRAPLVWAYKQSPFVKVQKDSAGNLEVVNMHPPVRYANKVIQCDDPTVPMAPPDDLAPLETLDKGTRDCIAKFKILLEERPIMVKRVQEQLLGLKSDARIRRAWPYVGYMFKQGPFRDAIIRYGVDPRTDPKYRFYQTLFFQLPAGPGGLADPKGPAQRRDDSGATPADDDNDDEHSAAIDASTAPGRRRRHRPKSKKANANRYVRVKPATNIARPADSHIFDGTRLCRDGKTWQICDISDPMLAPLIHTASLRDTFDPDFSGWYGSGTFAALRTLMKQKIIHLALAKEPRYDVPATFAAVIEIMPAHLTQENVAETYVGREGLPEVVPLLTKIRSVVSIKHRAREGKAAMLRDREAGFAAEKDGEEGDEMEIDGQGGDTGVADPQAGAEDDDQDDDDQDEDDEEEQDEDDEDGTDDSLDEDAESGADVEDDGDEDEDDEGESGDGVNTPAAGSSDSDSADEMDQDMQVDPQLLAP